MEITGYKQIDLMANTPQKHTLKNAKKVVFANMTPGDITISFLDTSEIIILSEYKTFEKDDLYNVSTRIQLSSTMNKRVELVVNGDLRNNTPIITNGGGGNTGSYDDTAIKQAIQINTDKITDNSRKIGVIEKQIQTNQNTISNVHDKVNANITQIGNVITQINNTETNVTNLTTNITDNTNAINNITSQLPQIEVNKVDITKLQNDSKELTRKIADNTNSIQTNTSAIANMSGEITQLTTSVNNVKNSTNANSTLINQLTTDVTTQSNEITQIDNKINTVLPTLQQIQTTTNTLETTVTNHTTQINELTNKVNENNTQANTQIGDLTNKIINIKNDIDAKFPQIETNKNDITRLNNIINNSISPDLATITRSQTYNTPSLNNGEYVIGGWTQDELLQQSYALTLSANTTFKLPQLSDDLNGDPTPPPNAPLRVPDKDKNNFIEVLLNITSELTLRYHDGGSFNQSVLLNPSQYQFIAKYNPIARSNRWEVNIYNLANTIDVYTPTISTSDPDNNDGKPNGAVWYKI